MDITKPLEEIINKGFPKPNPEFVLKPGQYKYVDHKLGKVIPVMGSLPTSLSKQPQIKVGMYFDGAFLPIRNGASYTLYNLMRALNSYSSDVSSTLVNCYRGWDEVSLYKTQEFSSLLMSPEDYYHNTDLLADLNKQLGLHIAQFYNTEIILRLASSLKKLGIKIVLDVQNIDHILAESINDSLEVIERAKQLQIEALALTDHNFCRSDIDMKHLISLGADPSKVSVYRGGIYTKDFEFKTRSAIGKKLVYLGHMYYEPNEVAVDTIIREILPKLGDDYSLTIIGNAPPYLNTKYQKPNVKFRGGVDDISTELGKYDIAIAPITMGSGTRLKLLDYLAAGVPTITTQLGIEGLDPRINKVMTVSDSLTVMIDTIRDMNDNPKQYINKAIMGRKFVEDEYDWSVITPTFIDGYKRIING